VHAEMMFRRSLLVVSELPACKELAPVYIHEISFSALAEDKTMALYQAADLFMLPIMVNSLLHLSHQNTSLCFLVDQS
jgi:hypothetical protein